MHTSLPQSSYPGALYLPSSSSAHGLKKKESGEEASQIMEIKSMQYSMKAMYLVQPIPPYSHQVVQSPTALHN